MLLLREQVTRCTGMAASKVAAVTELIHCALERDAKARCLQCAPPELSLCSAPRSNIALQYDSRSSKPGDLDLSSAMHGADLSTKSWAGEQDVIIASSSSCCSDIEMIEDDKHAGEVITWMKGASDSKVRDVLPNGSTSKQPKQWNAITVTAVHTVKVKQGKKKTCEADMASTVELSGSSEEEDVVIIKASDLGFTSNS